MITVDIYVPYLNVSYDFNLDETAAVGAVIEEAAAMICARERWPFPGSTAGLELYDPLQKKVLSRQGSLDGERVRSGQRLLLC